MTQRRVTPGFVEFIRDAALAGKPCPTSAQLADHFGWSGRKVADTVLRLARAQGLVRVESGTNFRVVSAPDGSWRTAAPDMLARYHGISVRRRANRLSAAVTAYRKRLIASGQDNSLQFAPRGKGFLGRRLPPVTDEAEARRLIDEAIAAGRVQRVAAACVAPVNNGYGL